MPALKIVVTVPEPLATRFMRVVPSPQRSAWIAEAMELQLRAAEEQLIAACEAANNDPDITELERDMDSLCGDGLDDHPWDQSDQSALR